MVAVVEVVDFMEVAVAVVDFVVDMVVVVVVMDIVVVMDTVFILLGGYTLPQLPRVLHTLPQLPRVLDTLSMEVVMVLLLAIHPIQSNRGADFIVLNKKLSKEKFLSEIDVLLARYRSVDLATADGDILVFVEERNEIVSVDVFRGFVQIENEIGGGRGKSGSPVS